MWWSTAAVAHGAAAAAGQFGFLAGFSRSAARTWTSTVVNSGPSSGQMTPGSGAPQSSA